MIIYLEKLILDNWGKWVEGNKPNHLDFLKIHAGQATRNKKVGFFVFNKQIPIIFVKTIRESKDNMIIEEEFEKLKNAYKKNNERLAPKPIYLGEYQSMKFSLEEAVVGTQFHSFNKEKHLNLFLNSFLDFQARMEKEKKLTKEELSHYLEKLSDGFIKLFKTEDYLTNLIKNITKTLKNNNLSVMPLISQHGDLTPDNVLINNQREVKIIDWDNFGKIELPLFDLLVFLQRWSGIRAVGFVNDYIKTIEDYLDKFNINKKSLKLLVFCYYLLDFIRKKKVLTDYDKKYLKLRLEEIKNLNFKS